MSWSFKSVRPKIRAFVGENDGPVNLWHKCSACAQMLFHRELEEHFHVRRAYEHQLRINAKQRLELWFDEGAYTRVGLSSVTADRVKFRNSRCYADLLKDVRTKSVEHEATIVDYDTISRLAVGASLLAAARGHPDCRVSARTRHGGYGGLACRTSRNTRPVALTPARIARLKPILEIHDTGTCRTRW